MKGEVATDSIEMQRIEENTMNNCMPKNWIKWVKEINSQKYKIFQS